MGLVTKTYNTHSQSGRVCTTSTSSSNKEETDSLDSTLVKAFNHVSAMAVLQVPLVVRNEFDQYVKYAEDLSNGVDTDTDMKALDTYLGTIGVTNGLC